MERRLCTVWDGEVGGWQGSVRACGEHALVQTPGHVQQVGHDLAVAVKAQPGRSGGRGWVSTTQADTRGQAACAEQGICSAACGAARRAEDLRNW